MPVLVALGLLITVIASLIAVITGLTAPTVVQEIFSALSFIVAMLGLVIVAIAAGASRIVAAIERAKPEPARAEPARRLSEILPRGSE